MMISGDQTNNVITAAIRRVEGATPRMSHSVSHEILEQAAHIASQTPDIRADRVEVATRRMVDGAVSAEEIATMMVRRIVAESLI